MSEGGGNITLTSEQFNKLIGEFKSIAEKLEKVVYKMDFAEKIWYTKEETCKVLGIKANKRGFEKLRWLRRSGMLTEFRKRNIMYDGEEVRRVAKMYKEGKFAYPTGLH